MLLDPRVRKAFAWTVDKAPINEAVYDNQAILADSMIVPTSEAGRIADAAVTKFTYDPRRADELMAQAGFARGGDGFYASPGEGRLSVQLKTNAASDKWFFFASTAGFAYARPMLTTSTSCSTSWSSVVTIVLRFSLV